MKRPKSMLSQTKGTILGLNKPGPRSGVGKAVQSGRSMLGGNRGQQLKQAPTILGLDKGGPKSGVGKAIRSGKSQLPRARRLLGSR